MKKAITVVLTIGLLAGSLAMPAEAAKKKKKKPAPVAVVERVERVVEVRYEASAIGSADSPATIYPAGPLFPVNAMPGPDERFAKIEIIDDFSPNASASFSWDSDGDRLNDSGFDVCSSTPEAVEVIPGTQYNIFPYLLPATSCTDAVATSGTIKITFSNLP